MKHKYVIIDSSKENHNSVDTSSKFKSRKGTPVRTVCV